MKKICLHPGLLVLMLASVLLLLSLLSFAKQHLASPFQPAYALVDDQLFYLGKPIYDAELGSFRVVGGGYAVDKNRVYYDGREVLGVDRNSFKVIDYGIATDNQGLWVFNLLRHRGATNYRPLGNLYYEADGKVYYFETEVTGADPETFKPLPKDYFARDASNYYYRGRVTEITQP